MSFEEREALLAALAFQLDCGVDEAISETPTNWTEAFAGAAEATPQRQSKAPQRGKPAAKPDASVPLTPAEERAAAVASARSVASAATDLAGLNAALAGFDGSSLKAGATTCVFSDGDPCARLMIIGEAPGREEDKVGKPFVGRSGQLLDAMLAAIGLDRKTHEPETAAYITNVVPFRPLQNRTPDDAEVSLLLPFLERHIALAQPEVILCIGNVPAKHVMGADKGITRFRGTWKDITVEGRTIPTLASFHPAYLLRSPEMKRHAWRDLLSLEQRLKSH